MSDFKIVGKKAKVDQCYGLEAFRITKEEIAALLAGKKLYSTVNCGEYAITIELGDSVTLPKSKLEKNSKKLEKDSEWQHDHAILKAYSDGANEVLDKIRAEIKTKYDSIPWRNNDYDDGWVEALEWVFDDVIGKYKSESEDKE
jgi:hypothetical protein